MTERVVQRVVAIALLLGWLDPLAHQARSENDPLQSRIEALSLTTEELKSEEFSPTSVLRGQASLVVGGNRFEGILCSRYFAVIYKKSLWYLRQLATARWHARQSLGLHVEDRD
mgnify:CR=1 FL=1|jgi:hypothetical protein